ncbi:MAG: bifunctional demethylmenaquinone methyltransferase/2-methoxy-6-polyprenyl-1,4-benzoquinol methylase UbiE [Bacteroidota bacterium]
MMEPIVPYRESNDSKKTQVSKMFDNVSSNYDQLNRVITFGMDVKWRENVLNIVANRKPETLLDIATGTGDMVILFSGANVKKIVGVDISDGMLSVAREKVKAQNLSDIIELKIADAESLPFETNSFDAVTVSYGIRNFEHLEIGLAEILRVLKPGGIFVILETSVPEKFPFRQGYFIHTKVFLPLIGRLFSKDKRAYSYLSSSAINFPYGAKLKAILEGVGYTQVEVLPQSKGISTIYKAFKA